MTDRCWLEDVVLVNENRDEAVAGDVSLFRSAGEACRYLEHWWVENEEGTALNGIGERLVLGVDSQRQVIVLRREPCAEGEALVLNWLRSLAASTLEMRKLGARKGRNILGEVEDDGVLPTTIEGLIAYVGRFER